jgi:hypothetical protein
MPLRSIIVTVVAVTALWFVPTRAAQRGGGAPTPAASVPTPRAADGHPDLSGRWGGGGGDADVRVREPGGKIATFDDYTAYERAVLAGTLSPQAVLIGRETNYRHGDNDYSGKDAVLGNRYEPNPPLYKPEHWEKVQYLDTHGNTEDTSFSCLPGGLPRMGPPSRILQTTTDLVFLYNTNNFLNVFDWRVVPTDGRPHHPVYAKDQTFMGDSVGTWEGDTLVVDVVGFNDLTWLGFGGWFHTSDLRVVEKFRREGNELHYDVTVHDPEVLIEPWQMEHRVLRLNPSTVYTEDPPCIERDAAHLVSRIRG